MNCRKGNFRFQNFRFCDKTLNYRFWFSNSQILSEKNLTTEKTLAILRFGKIIEKALTETVNHFQKAERAGDGARPVRVGNH